MIKITKNFTNFAKIFRPDLTRPTRVGSEGPPDPTRWTRHPTAISSVEFPKIKAQWGLAHHPGANKHNNR